MNIFSFLGRFFTLIYLKTISGCEADPRSPLLCRFAAQTISSRALVLVSLELKESTATLTINTEKSVMASVLLRDLKQALAQA